MKRNGINDFLYEETRKHLTNNGDNPDEKAEIDRLTLYYFLTDALVEQGLKSGLVSKKNGNPLIEVLFMVLTEQVVKQVLDNVFGTDDGNESDKGGGHSKIRVIHIQRRVTGL